MRHTRSCSKCILRCCCRFRRGIRYGRRIRSSFRSNRSDTYLGAEHSFHMERYRRYRLALQDQEWFRWDSWCSTLHCMRRVRGYRPDRFQLSSRMSSLVDRLDMLHLKQRIQVSIYSHKLHSVKRMRVSKEYKMLSWYKLDSFRHRRHTEVGH